MDDLRKEMKVSHGDKTGQGRVVQQAYELAKKYAAAKQCFVWNSTNLTSDMRSKLINKLSVYNPFLKYNILKQVRKIFSLAEEKASLFVNWKK